MHFPLPILLSLPLTAAFLIPAIPIPPADTFTPIKRQLSLTGGWALRTPTCSSAFQSCHSTISFPGQDACCPPNTTCVAGTMIGDIKCCPPGDKYCGGDVGHPQPAQICANAEWSLWADAYNGFFCCEKGLQGYWNRETYGFGELCAAPGVTTETAGGGDTLVAATATTSLYTFKRTTVTGTTSTTGAATGTTGTGTAGMGTTSTGSTGVGGTEAAATGTPTGTPNSNSNANDNTNINQITINGSNAVFKAGLVGGGVVWVLAACFMVY